MIASRCVPSSAGIRSRCRAIRSDCPRLGLRRMVCYDMRLMKIHFWIVVVIALAALPLAAQQKHPDLNGIWQGPYTPDLSRTLPRGETIPFTPYGAERYKAVDPANNPDGLCLPVGPARGFQSPAPFQLVQTDNVIAVLFENQRIFRI